MAGSTDGELPGGSNRKNSHSGDDNGGCRHFLRRFSLEILAVAFLVIGGLCFLSLDYSSSVPYGSFSDPILRRLIPPAMSPENDSPTPAPPSLSPVAHGNNDDLDLINVLERAAMKPDEQPTTSRGTVIITTLNNAWTEPGSLLDIFMESFWVGNGTQKLVRHLVIVTVDDKAHAKCQTVHPHCYRMTTPGFDFSEESRFMTGVYLDMMWRRLEFLGSVLRLGYDFVFTDTDILWFKNPFPHFDIAADFHISADVFTGNTSDDRNSLPSCGFMFFRSNVRTIRFHKFWYDTKFRFPIGTNEQDAFNRIKFDPFLDEIGLRIRFLDTDYFGGNCSPVRDLELACTMHANCLVGLETKLRYLRNVLDDWRRFASLRGTESRNSSLYEWMRH
ncbi:Uncharacterized protein At4g15970 [Linum perenne]